MRLPTDTLPIGSLLGYDRVNGYAVWLGMNAARRCYALSSQLGLVGPVGTPQQIEVLCDHEGNAEKELQDG